MDYYHPLAWDLDPTISSLSNGNESFSHSIACYTGVCSQKEIYGYSVPMFSLGSILRVITS